MNYTVWNSRVFNFDVGNSKVLWMLTKPLLWKGWLMCSEWEEWEWAIIMEGEIAVHTNTDGSFERGKIITIRNVHTHLDIWGESNDVFDVPFISSCSFINIHDITHIRSEVKVRIILYGILCSLSLTRLVEWCQLIDHSQDTWQSHNSTEITENFVQVPSAFIRICEKKNKHTICWFLFFLFAFLKIFLKDLYSSLHPKERQGNLIFCEIVCTAFGKCVTEVENYWSL